MGLEVQVNEHGWQCREIAVFRRRFLRPIRNTDNYL
jgi:hypothetical protein